MKAFFLAHPAVAGAFSGLMTAAAVDFQAFRSWKSINEALSYSWGTALWRWFQGAVIGAATSAGLTSLLG